MFSRCVEPWASHRFWFTVSFCKGRPERVADGGSCCFCHGVYKIVTKDSVVAWYPHEDELSHWGPALNGLQARIVVGADCE